MNAPPLRAYALSAPLAAVGAAVAVMLLVMAVVLLGKQVGG